MQQPMERIITIGDQNIGLAHPGPDLSAPAAERYAQQLSHFMSEVVYTGVYEGTFGLTANEERPFPFEDESNWLTFMSKSNTPRERSTQSYIELVVATALDADGNPSEDESATAGLVITTKPGGHPCTDTHHIPTNIAEIDVAPGMRRKGLGLFLLDALVETHPEDPRITADMYRNNEGSIAFHESLGLVLDETAEPVADLYGQAGDWVARATTGAIFAAHLADKLAQ